MSNPTIPQVRVYEYSKIGTCSIDYKLKELIL